MTIRSPLDFTARLVAPIPKFGLAIFLGASLLIGTLVFGSLLVLQKTRQTALDVAETRLQNSASVVVSVINRQLLQVDGALVSLPSLFAAYSDGQTNIDPQAARRILRSFNFETFSFRDLLLITPDGAVWAAARPRPNNLPLLLTSRDGTASARPGAAVVDGPIYNATTGDWSWYLSRPISLRGVGRLQAVAEVPISSLMALLAPAAAVQGLSIYIERPDGLRLASLPHDEMTLGKQQATTLSRLKDEGIAFRLPAWLATSSTIAVWRNTLYPDVQVALRLDLGASMTDWARDRNRLLVVLAVACLLVVALACTLYVALRQRERVEMERKRSRDLLDGAIEAMSDGFVMWDDQDRLITCNHRFCEIYTLSAPFIQPGVRFEDIVREGAKLGQYPQAGDDVDEFVRETVEWHHSNQGSLERLLPNGNWIQVTERHNPTGGIVGIRTDITVLKNTMADLAAANEKIKQAMEELQTQNVALTERDQELRIRNMLFTAALNNMSQGLLMVDSDRRLIVCNKRFQDLFQVSERHVSPGTTTAALFRLIEAGGCLSPLAVESIYKQQEELAAAQQAYGFVSSEDEGLVLAVSQRPLPDGGWIATYEDVTERHRTETRIRFMAHHDGLTALPNRTLFRHKVADALAELPESGSDLALLYLDLDRFKHVNDTLGHSAGDALLEIVARRLQGCVRDVDLVARLGGDEFAVLHLSRDLPGSALCQAERIIEVLSRPYKLGQRQVDVGVSIGIAIAGSRETTGEGLLKNADLALYQAKANGRGTYCLFEPEMEAKLHTQLSIEADLRVAIQQEQLEIYYQPIVEVRDDRVCGFEALLRWNHPTRGLVSPAQFIPLAEELGIIKTIGAWVLRRACADAARSFDDDMKIAVNLSPIQLEDDDVIETVRAALADSGLRPERLEIEITESALLNKSVRTVDLLRQLHDLGLMIALDDFGTGYSSLSYLRSFPFDAIKIDRLFISEMGTRDDCTAIVGAIVKLAERLGMSTTAEGVEVEEQLQLIRDLGCTAVQGYLLGKPQRLEDAVTYCQRNKSRLFAQQI